MADEYTHRSIGIALTFPNVIKFNIRVSNLISYKDCRHECLCGKHTASPTHASA